MPVTRRYESGRLHDPARPASHRPVETVGPRNYRLQHGSSMHGREPDADVIVPWVFLI